MNARVVVMAGDEPVMTGTCCSWMPRSAQADLAEDALTGEKLRGEADHESEHGKAAIPGFGEGDETEAGIRPNILLVITISSPGSF